MVIPDKKRKDILWKEGIDGAGQVYLIDLTSGKNKDEDEDEVVF